MVVLGLVFTCWWVGLGPRVSGSCPLVCDIVPEASAGSLAGRVMSCGPASAFWVGDWVLGPVPSGGQHCVLDRLWAKGVL